MKICIIGTGYVGLVTGTCLSDFGLEVTCVDKDSEKIKGLNSGKVPIYEQNLESLIKKNVTAGRLSFTTDIKKAIKQSKAIFIAVGTPPNDDGSANLQQIERVAQEIAAFINEYKVIVNKSTVPVGTAVKIKEIISDNQNVIAREQSDRSNPHLNRRTGVSPVYSIPFDVVSNPEFLREGSAVYDFTHPDKIVIGTNSDRALKIMQEIYRPLYLIDTPFVITNPETAELIKYACNAFLATKITFINEIANLCDKVGADVHQIARAMGLDGRISPKFLHPGPGYGGSCFPKDTEALCNIAASYGYEFKTLEAVVKANKRQRELMVDKIKHHLGDLKGKTIGILGLAFKQNTDDIRKSSSIDIIQLLLKEGVNIRCFDPLAMDNNKNILPDLNYCQDEYETSAGSGALVIATEWNQFRNLDLLRIKKLLKIPILIDLRNLYEPEKVKSLGFIYEGVGRW
ncbi:MAG TPA: UDP-glucose/GDP-mannose dehydrogenase family protein [candidate division WOR-3 bacterium]|uniref:UDP-glucose 6-dehydrogenase n=1 Tax=candidate division WOR-3 bacterium TaxID=2052148 RepID=A0A7C5DGW0_UNCW3|nr:UDP-glucose/GDP-mannose dehydrogenase family protein [candidate division WOR-3 bacterium]